MFLNDDEFGVQSYRDDFRHVFKSNIVKVKLIRSNPIGQENLQGDFLGIKTNSYPDAKETIDININSDAPDKRLLEQEGFTDKGIKTFSCYVEHGIDLSNLDMIEFIDDYDKDVKKGQKFRIEIESEGMYKMQYTFIHFNIFKI